uniref:Ring finger protein 4 n=1 Tax=Cyprinus carpio carpio TaxID=630221 RepID=A0A8C1BS42_CYPCA
MSTATQRKRRTSSATCSRRGNGKRSRTQMSQTAMETIDVLESDRTNSGDVVDLTCEGSEPAVVDLTNNDSIVVVEDGVQSRRGQGPESYVLSSDEEEESSLRLSPGLLSSLHASSRARSTPGAVSCPVCMDAYSEVNCYHRERSTHGLHKVRPPFLQSVHPRLSQQSSQLSYM